MFDDGRKYVAPLLPTGANFKIEEWKAKKGKPVLQKVVEQKPGAHCKNCQDVGYIYLMFIHAGPFRYVPQTGVGKVATWFDGNMILGKGWYIVSTEAFMCSNCAGRPYDQPAIIDDEAEIETPYWDD